MLNDDHHATNATPVRVGNLVITPGRNREHELFRAFRAGYFGPRDYEDLIVDTIDNRRWIIENLTARRTHYIDLMHRSSHAAPTPAEVDGIWHIIMAETMELREIERAQSGPNIRTTYDPKPIPDRRYDWTAIDADTYDGLGCPIGYGLTEADAIADLKEKLA